MDTLVADAITTEIQLNEQQKAACDSIKSFSCDAQHDVFILKGSAGTGKTTIVRLLVEYLESKSLSYKLFAPTNQAAKVLSNHTGRPAKTLHSFLYRINEIEHDAGVRMEFVKREVDFTKPHIFIIDEASMISSLASDNELFISKNSPLFDLVDHLKKSPSGSKIIFIGDEYQLPPVHENFSPALSQSYMENNYDVKVGSFELTQIMRQKEGGYLLQNALMIRDIIQRKHGMCPPLRYKKLYNPLLAVDHFCKSFNPATKQDKIFLAWKNITVADLNDKIRKKLFKRTEQVLYDSDQVIVSQSYYYQNIILPKGEIGRVTRFYPESMELVAGIRFANADLEFSVSDDTKISVNVLINVDYLVSNSKDDIHQKQKKLWAERKKRNKVFRETDNPSDDVYVSALKLNYGYAITAHKAQGSEWSEVYLHPEYPIDSNRLKWLYTSVTRAKKELYSY
jgi:exodeoxyribonuclease V